MRSTRALTTWIPCLLLTLLPACGGGGGGGSETVDSLSAPDQVSLVTPDESGLGASPSGGEGANAPAVSDFATDSDYATDAISVHVYDPSMEELGVINMILCFMAHTGYEEMLNQGNYKAQLDKRLCRNGEEESDEGSSGQSSSSEASQFDIFTLNSSRSSRSTPQIVKIWLPEEEEGNKQIVHAKLTLTNGTSESDPFGSFHMDFAGVVEGGTVEDPRFWGALGTVEDGSSDGFQMFQNHGDVDEAHDQVGMFSLRSAVALATDDATDSGVARLRLEYRENFGMGDSGLQSQEWKVAYNATHYKRQLGDDPEVTLSRTDFLNRAWRYNLYYAEGDLAGQRVELDSGFGFRTEDNDYGWIGYWGLWAPEGVSIENGDTIYRREDGSSTETPYTVVKAPGKLIRHARETLDLVALHGQTFQWWRQSDQTSYLVDYSDSGFEELAYYDSDSQEWVTIEPPLVIDVASEGGYLQMWSETLGGSVSYLDGDSWVTFYSHQFVTCASELFDQGDEVVLYGLVQCLDSEITGAEAEAGDVYMVDAADVDHPYVFRFDREQLTLYHDVDGDGLTLSRVGLADGEEPSNGPYMWGMSSGPLLLSTAGLSNNWDAWGADVFYTYETGHNPWNGYTSVLDSLGGSVQFDAPLQFLYTHSAANDLNGDDSYDRHNYLLNYGGPGDLWGIPHEGIDLTGDDLPDRWYPLFSIAPGTLVGPTGVEYVLKPVEIEQTLQEDPGGAPGLDLSAADSLILPDASMYTTPDIGSKPSVPGPPAVVNGVVVNN